MADPDVRTANFGSIWTFHAQTAKARLWIAQHVQDSAADGSIIAEHRCGRAIAEGMLDAGLTLLDCNSGRVARRERATA